MAKKSRDYFVFPARGSSGDINKATEDIKDTIYKSVAGLNVESNKSVSITQNGTVTITPSSGKDVMSAVTATVNVSGGSADLENNKTATIDVSTYTEPVEIEPTEGKDGMKKATVTLSNIPSGGSATAYSWREKTTNEIIYTNFSTAPDRITSSDSNYKILYDNDVENGLVYKTLVDWGGIGQGHGYFQVSDNDWGIEDSDSFAKESEYERYIAGDIPSFW